MATLALNKRGLLVEILVGGQAAKLVDRDSVQAVYSVNTEVQTVALVTFDATDSFKFTYNGSESAIVTRGTNYTTAGMKAVIEAIAGFSGTVTVSPLTGSTLTDSGFIVTFNFVDPHVLTITSATGCSGTVTNPGDSVVFTLKAVAYTHYITELTMNSNAVASYANFLTEMATTFG